jgi:hypothetical protein
LGKLTREEVRVDDKREFLEVAIGVASEVDVVSGESSGNLIMLQYPFSEASIVSISIWRGTVE